MKSGMSIGNKIIHIKKFTISLKGIQHFIHSFVALHNDDLAGLKAAYANRLNLLALVQPLTCRPVSLEP